MSSLAAVYASHLSSDARSVGESFHCRTGSTCRIVNRVRCSPRVTENHSLVRLMPSLTSICSNSGAWRMNSSCWSGVQKPITRSTPARLYQDRSNRTISPAAGQVSDVTLEVPLRALTLGGLLERDDAGAARVQVLHEALDGAALARRVTALEHDDVTQPVRLAPLLQLQQFDLQQPLVLLVLVARHALVVRVALAPGVDVGSAGMVHQHGVVIVVVADAVVLGSLELGHRQKVSTRP